MRTSSNDQVWQKESNPNQNYQRQDQHHPSSGKGWLAAVGIGPGGGISLSLEGRNMITEADIIVGYKTYLDLISELVSDKEIYCSGMKQEVQRCQKAIDLADQGYNVAVVSSGDPGVYGMAGVILELNQDPDLNIHIVPGITSATGAASVLGAPIMHDFAVISLSDLLTPWDKIIKRVELAAEGDFVIVLYNPKSKQRTEHIEHVRNKLLEIRSPETPVGIVANNYRSKEKVVISNLKDFTKEEIDMRTTVIIGNSQSYTKFGQIITSRGYPL